MADSDLINQFQIIFESLVWHLKKNVKKEIDREKEEGKKKQHFNGFPYFPADFQPHKNRI